MGRVSLIHAADIHLGRPFVGLGGSSPELGALFRRASYQAWRNLVATAVAEDVDVVTLAGDVFDEGKPTVRARVAFRDGITRLHAAGIPVFLALGNHDPLASFPPSLLALDGLHVFGAEPETAPLIGAKNAPSATISGVSYQSAAVTENLAAQFRRDPDAAPAIGVLHTNVAGESGHEDYAPCSLGDLKSTGMDAWLLGHVHSPKILCRDPLVLYPGVSQGAHIRENGPRGCYKVVLESGAPPECEFIPLAPVLWEGLQPDVTGVSGEEEIVDRAEDAASRLVEESGDVEAIVVRITVTGFRPFPSPFRERGAEDLAETLAERLMALRTPVFVESIRDRSRPNVDLDILKTEEGFFGEFLRLCERVPRDPDLLAELLGPIRSELSKRSYKGKLRDVTPPQILASDPAALDDLLRETELRVAEMFLEGGSR